MIITKVKTLFIGSILLADYGFVPNILVKGKYQDEDVVGVVREIQSVEFRKHKTQYEIWGSDQSNSVPGQDGVGINGSFLWIWDSKSVEKQIKEDIDAVPLSCTPSASAGPCNLLDVFPSSLKEMDANHEETGNRLSDLPKFGRLHGMLKDPLNKYVTANIFAPGGGYVGVINTQTKEAVGLFRVTEFDQNPSLRSVHLSFWSNDGSAILVSNLHGKAIERIDVTRDGSGTITKLSFNKLATIGLGKGMTVKKEATYFSGTNAFGNSLVSDIVGEYSDEGLSDLTPNGLCKENGCSSGDDGMAGGRPNNLPISPIPSSNNKAYVTLAGGGLFVIDFKVEPMAIMGEYGSGLVNGAGLVGSQVGNKVFLNCGVSAGSSGHEQSTFTLYSFDDTKYESINEENSPMPVRVFQDPGNTRTLGNVEGPGGVTNNSGQIPGITTRRDSHGTAITQNGNWIHVNDRIQNVIEVFDTRTYKRKGVYDLVSIDGKSGRSGPSGPCFSKSVLDDGALALNDPSPDLMELTPDGKYLVIGFRGPVPVSVNHSAQGSCPGVGVVMLTNGGKSGRLVTVLRSINRVDDVTNFAVPGGTAYSGAERSDVHSAIAIANGWD